MHLPKPQIIDPSSVPSLRWGSSAREHISQSSSRLAGGTTGSTPAIRSPDTPGEFPIRQVLTPARSQLTIKVIRAASERLRRSSNHSGNGLDDAADVQLPLGLRRRPVRRPRYELSAVFARVAWKSSALTRPLAHQRS